MNIFAINFWVLIQFLFAHGGDFYLPEIGSAQTCKSSAYLVAPSEGSYQADKVETQTVAGHFGPTSLKGLDLFEPNPTRNGSRLGRTLEVLHVPQDQRQACGILRPLWGLLGKRTPAQHSAHDRFLPEGLDIQSMGRLAIWCEGSVGRFFGILKELLQTPIYSEKVGKSPSQTTGQSSGSQEQRPRKRSQRVGWRWSVKCAAIATPSCTAALAYTGPCCSGGFQCHNSFPRSSRSCHDSATAGGESRDCSPPTGCLSRCPNASPGGHCGHRKSRAGTQEECHQVLAQCHKGFRQSSKTVGRNIRGKTGAPQQLASAPFREHQDMGIPTGSLSQTWCSSAGNGTQSESRYSSSPCGYPEAQFTGVGRQLRSCSFAGAACRRRPTGRHNGFGGGAPSFPTSRYLTNMCQFTGSIFYSSGRGANHSFRRGEGHRSCYQQTTAISRSGGRSRWHGLQVTFGSANPCPSVKGLHDATRKCRALEMVEAYGCSDFTSCAAGHSRASDWHMILPFCHSALFESKFTDPFRAVCKAEKLRFSVLCDQWSTSFKSLQQHFDEVSSLSMECRSSVIPHRSPAKGPCSTRSVSTRHVQFSSDVVVCHVNSLEVVVTGGDEAFHAWPGKSWRMKKSKHSHALPHPCKISLLCELFDSKSADPWVDRQCDESTLFGLPQEPLSNSAVLIRGGHDMRPQELSWNADQPAPCSVLSDITNIQAFSHKSKVPFFVDVPDADDASFLMQRPSCLPRANKQSPFPEDGEGILEGVAQGQADPMNLEGQEFSDEAVSDGYSATDVTESSHVAPPSSPGQRNEAILYHLADPPLRVFLDWTDFDTMIQEIARHFGRETVEVLDAYEVQPYPHDTPEGVTPIIVHLFEDIAVGHPAKLVLLDTELHGHSFEVNYAVGPTTSRTVVRLPELCVRQSVLISANVDLYCQQESDTCFVWHGHVRWPDDDPQARRLRHGEYFRVAVPPTGRFICSTVDAVALSQQGLSDQEILDHMTGEDVGLNLSPSLLSSEEVRNLAHTEVSDHDDEELFQALQMTIVRSHEPADSPIGSKAFAPGFSVDADPSHCKEQIPEDGIGLPSTSNEATFYDFNPTAPVSHPEAEDEPIADLHMHTLATQWLAAARSWDESAPSARFVTWRVSPATGSRFCLNSRDVVLYGDMENWRHYILQRWADQNDPMFPADIISVSPHPAQLEPGVAGHIIIQQHPLMAHAPALVTITDPAVNQGVLKRQVHVLADRSRPLDILFFAGYHMDCPHFADCQVRLRERLLPMYHEVQIMDGDAFDVNIVRTQLPDNWIPPTIPLIVEPEEAALFQLSTEIKKSVLHVPAGWSGAPSKTPVEAPVPRTCSLTDEFIQAVRRFGNVQEQEVPPIVAPGPAVDLPTALQELWDICQHLAVSGDAQPDPQFRVETWFLDHVNIDRCYHSRIVTLSSDLSIWHRVLLQHWSDRHEAGARIEFALVYPAPDDQAVGTVAQLILTQFPQDNLCSVVLSVYDTGRNVDTPRTFALVHGLTISLSSMLEEVRLTQDCPPHVSHTECALWFGSTHIPASRQAFVRSGNAFRLCIRRGQLIRLQDLLALPDEMIRRHLQEAIHGEIYQRPPGPRFPGDAYAINPLPQSRPYRPSTSSASTRPQWIEGLTHLFGQYSATELLEEGPVLYIQSWYVNGQTYLWCNEPRAVRLTGDFTQWRPAIAQTWHDRLEGSLPAEFWVVQPVPPFTARQGVTVHVIVSQSMHSDQAAVLLTAMQAQEQDASCQHSSYVLPRNSLGEDLARFAVPPWFRSSMMTVFFEGQQYSFDATVSLHSGANVIVRYGEYERAPPTRSDDHAMFLQLHMHVTSKAPLPGISGLPVKVVTLEHAIDATDEDVAAIPLSIGQFLSGSSTPWIVCAWEMPYGNTETVLLDPADTVGRHTIDMFRQRHDFLRPVSQLFSIRFLRPGWHTREKQVWIGSFRVPSHDQAIVFCVRYQSDGAVYGVRTFPATCSMPGLRQSLSIQHGTKVRCNGQVLSTDTTFNHGDVLEFHAAPYSAGFDMCRTHNRVQICLDATIPVEQRAFDADKDAVLMLQHPNFAQCLASPEHWNFAFLPEGIDLHPATFEALHRQPEWLPTPPQVLELYVDGATCKHTSAWAVVAVAVSPMGRTLYGCASGITQINPAQPQWIGATHHGNIDAELSAMTIATAFAFCACQEYHVCIRPDLALSRQIACSLATTRKPSVLAQTLHALGQQVNDKVSTQEVRAHCSDPWNELADRLAKWTAAHSREVGSVPWQPLHDLACSASDRAWGWLHQAPKSLRSTFPNLHDEAIWQPSPSNHVIHTHIRAAAESFDPTSVQFKIVTYNALALDESDVALRLPGPRSIRVDHQFHLHQVAFIGLQETRMPEGQRVTDHYRVFSSGFAQCGRTRHYGCELWIHKTLPLANQTDGKSVTAADFRFTVMASDPRYLMVRLQGPFDIYILVAHAPCQSADRPLDQVRIWWQHLGAIASLVPNDALMFCCIDANAPLADASTTFFDTHQAEPTNGPGQAFQEFLTVHEMYVPATFSWHQGDGATWRHPQGHLLRRDYVTASHQAFRLVTGSQVLADFDSGFGHQDHYPAQLTVNGFLPASSPGAKLRWDFAKLADPQARREFEDALRTLPLPTWQIDIDAHSGLLETHILQLAQQHFGKPPRAKQRPVLSQITLSGIALKRQALQLLRNEGMSNDPALVSELRQLEKAIRPLVQADQKKWYAMWLDDIDLAARRCDTAQVYKKLQRLGRKKPSQHQGPRPLPKLVDPTGRVASSFEECQQIWCAQFGQLEAGVTVTPNQLQQLHVQRPTLYPDDPSCLMSAHDIMAAIRRMRSGKVPGPGKLPIDVLKAGGFTMAQALLPLMTKAAWHMHEPISWKGGLLVPLFKGKGSPQDAKGYRSIFISDVCGKIHHSHLRKTLVCDWSTHADLIQQGGKQGCSTDIAHHLLHAYFAWARAHSVSCAMLFVDLHAAFYTVIRAMLMNEPIHDDLLCQAMSRLGITPDDWHNVLKTVQSENAVSTMGLHHQGILADMFEGTHFIMPGVGQPVATFRGTRPGDPVADVLFNMAFRLIVLDARQTFQRSSNLPFLGTPQVAPVLCAPDEMPTSGFTEVTFVDDIAYALHGPSAEQVIASLQLVASCLHDAATNRGMQLNYQAGKTEAMVFCAGPGSRSVRKRLWHDLQGRLPVVTEAGTQELRIVHAYKHLGSFIQCQAVVHKDASFRVSQARQAFGQLQRPFYGKRNIELRTKTAVFSALVVARHAYNVHTWAWFTPDDVGKWANGLQEAASKLARPLVRPVPIFHFSVEDLFGLLQLPSPLDLLHANRLRYAKRAVTHAPPLLWQLVCSTQHGNTWGPAFLESCKWFCLHFPGTFELPCDDFQACMHIVALDDRWFGKVKRALQSATRHRSAAAQGKLWTLRIEHQLQRFSDEEFFPKVPSPSKWTCTLCEESFDSKRGLAIHARHRHGYTKHLKYFVLSDECLACGKKFFQRSRALAHVTAATTCKATYLQCFVPAPEALVVELAQADLAYARAQKAQGWRPTKAFVPALRIPMPCLPAPGTADAADMQHKWTCRTASPGDAFQMLDGFCTSQDEPAAADDLIIPFLAQSTEGRVQGAAGAYQTFGLAAETARLHIKSYLFIHFYSGYRREGDLQSCIEAQYTLDGAVLYCLSIDLCLAKENSDLTDPVTCQFWKDQIASGQILGCGGGPSCETWSAARHSPGGPRPVRSYDAPWGLPGLTKAEAHQVSVGTALVQFLLELLVMVAQRGLCGFLEHPAFATWLMRQRPASVWTLRSFRAMARLACTSIITFDQCIFDLPAQKPTTLLLVRLPDFANIVRGKGRRGRCSHPGGHQPLRGRTDAGQFCTARAKVYPASMNMALAVSISRFLADRNLFGSQQPAAHLAQLNSSAFMDQTVIQPDFHG